MNNPRLSKRKRQAILFFTYGFMTLATIVISAICILLVLGYRFDLKDQRLEQGGLVQFRSTPSGAEVTVDGARQRFTTPGKLEVPAGTHSFEMTRQGYHSWSKRLTIDPGELRWLNYARLVPETITTARLAAADDIVDAKPTPDRKFVAALSSAKPSVITLYDLRDITKVALKTYTIPDGLVTTSDQPATYQIQEWDFGSRYLLVSRTTTAGVEYLRMDRAADNGAFVNITKEFNLPFREPHFSGTSGSVFYALTGGDLRRVDAAGKSVSSPLVSGVESYRLYRDNDIAFVAVRSDKKVAGVVIDGKETIVRSYGVADTVLIDLTEYFSHRYAAVAHGQRVEIIKDPTQVSAVNAGRNYASFDVAFMPLVLDFTSSGRFVSAGSGRAYELYDLETDERAAVNTADSAPALRPASWIDDFYLADNAGDTFRIYEFDGSNAHAIAKADPHLPVFFSENGRYLISFGVQADKLVMQSSAMVVE